MHGIRRCILASIVLVLALPPFAQAATDSAAESGSTSPSAAPASVMLWQPGDPGERLFLRGRVVDSNGQPLAGAVVALRQADGNGDYRDVRYRATLQTAKDGTFSVSTVLPGQYWGEKHIHVLVHHQSHGQLATRILFKGDPNLNQASDRDFVILLEEVHKDGEKILVGGVELVLPPKVGN